MNLQQLFRIVKKVLFAKHCCFCSLSLSQEEKDICLECKASLPYAVDRCYRCGLRLEKENEIVVCEKCQNNPPIFSRLCAIYSYDPPIQKLITGLKFHNQLAYGRILAEQLIEAVENQWYKNLPLPEAIIPVPLYKNRLRARGYNQVLELLLPMRKQNKMPVLYKQQHCRRNKKTKRQSGLNAEARRQNLKEAFQVQLPMPYQHVALVDDVVTTGSTVTALSKVLQKAGVYEIDVWCICRA